MTVMQLLNNREQPDGLAAYRYSHVPWSMWICVHVYHFGQAVYDVIVGRRAQYDTWPADGRADAVRDWGEPEVRHQSRYTVRSYTVWTCTTDIVLVARSLQPGPARSPQPTAQALQPTLGHPVIIVHFPLTTGCFELLTILNNISVRGEL